MDLAIGSLSEFSWREEVKILGFMAVYDPLPRFNELLFEIVLVFIFVRLAIHSRGLTRDLYQNCPKLAETLAVLVYLAPVEFGTHFE